MAPTVMRHFVDRQSTVVLVRPGLFASFYLRHVSCRCSFVCPSLRLYLPIPILVAHCTAALIAIIRYHYPPSSSRTSLLLHLRLSIALAALCGHPTPSSPPSSPHTSVLSLLRISIFATRHHSQPSIFISYLPAAPPSYLHRTRRTLWLSDAIYYPSSSRRPLLSQLLLPRGPACRIVIVSKLGDWTIIQGAARDLGRGMTSRSLATTSRLPCIITMLSSKKWRN